MLAALLVAIVCAAHASAEDSQKHRDTKTTAVTADLHRAVGRLLIPGIRYENGYARHYNEQCSATLISMPPAKTSPYLLSAWHCLENYRDLSRPLRYADARGQEHPVTILASGGGMDRDWALLRTAIDLPGAIPLARESINDSSKLVLSGYPRSLSDPELTILHDCRITGQDDRDLQTDCVLQRGASGGAVLRSDGGMTYVGVISRGDSVSQSIFVPLSRFLRDIRAYLYEAP